MEIEINIRRTGKLLNWIAGLSIMVGLVWSINLMIYDNYSHIMAIGGWCIALCWYISYMCQYNHVGKLWNIIMAMDEYITNNKGNR